MDATAMRIEQTNPEAYRRKLTNLLGGKEPLEVLSATPGVLLTIARETPASVLRHRPFPGKWTPNEVLGHLADGEWVAGYRTRTILCDDRPRVMPYDQERWVATQRHNDREPEELAESFGQLRRLNLAVWGRFGTAELRRAGLHEERGEETLDTMLRMLAGHDLSHIDQIRRYVAAAAAQL